MNSIKDIWVLVLDYCRKNVNSTACDLWLSDIEPESFNNEELVLMFPNAFKRDIVKERFNETFQKAIEETTGLDIKIAYAAPEDLLSPEEENRKNIEAYKRNEYTFDNFIVGSSNKFAYAAAKAIAANPGGNDKNQTTRYNPLFIHGNSGLGKTHLLNAICYEVGRNYPNMQILYTRGEDFTNEFIRHLTNKDVDVFKDKYRNVDLLLVDDIQFIAGKQAVQEEFFHTFDALVSAGKQVVLTSDRPPKEIQTLEERLRSRFEWGLIADLQSPDFETRIAIIKRKANILDFHIDDDVIEYIAEKIKSNVRQLEGTVKKLHAKYEIEHQVPTIMLAQSIIKDILTDNQPAPVTIKKIVSEVSRTFTVSVEDIYSEKRKANIANARKIALYIIREVTGLSFEMIGEEFGKHHSTIMYSVDQIQKEMEKDSRLAATINDIIKNIKEN